MPRRHLHMTGADGAALRAALRDLRTKLDVPGEFPAEVLAEAERVARDPRLPAYDATDLPLFTLDPPTSRDLDQAMHLARRPGGGYRVHYAIADVAAFVTPGGALDAEAHRRVTTLYFPDGNVPLHPAVLSEGAASLLPDRDAPALLWRFDLDADGRVETTEVRRALVRSRAKLDYAGVQRAIDSDTAEETVALLKDVGVRREALETERGGISLAVPDQEIVEHDGAYTPAYRIPLPADGWNAQMSLMTGMAAAELMLAAGAGILRTLPNAPDGAVGRLHRVAKALRIEWPHHVPYAELVRSLDPRLPNHAAFLQECTTLLRGAGYTVFTDGRTPDPLLHAAVAAPYTHCTAPLRRLVDRYTGELCVAAAAGVAAPAWAVDALEGLPREMAEGNRLANTVERESVNLVEAALLTGHVGDTFDAVVIDVKEREPLVGTVHLEDLAVVGRVESPADALPLGERIRVRLTEADPGTARILFAPA